MNLSITGGATCDYVRVKHMVGETDLSEQIAEPEDASFETNTHAKGKTSSHASSTVTMKIEGEHGRINRLSRAANATCHDEEDQDDCDFWMGVCKDVDCIYVGDHCRHQCAMAESDNEAPEK